MSPMRLIRNAPVIRERHWWFYVILPLVAVIWFLDGPYTRILDRQSARGPDWVQPQITVMTGPGSFDPKGKPMILYNACASREVTGNWTLRIEHRSQSGEWVQGDHAKGTGSYADCIERLRTWDWMFFGSTVDVPTHEFRLCVFYDLVSASGVKQRTDTYCSEPVRL